MEITLNNRKEQIDKDNITVSELLDLKNFTFKMLVIKVNKKLLSRLAIYTHNTKLFYKVTKLFRENNISFTALDSFYDTYPSLEL